MAFEAIVVGDVLEGLFSQRDVAEQQKYVDLANEEVTDIAKTFEVDELDIATPTHSKIKEYAVYYALQRFGFDNMNLNNNAGYSNENDVYKDLFMRSDMMCQRAKADLVAVMFTGEDETSLSRAVGMTRLYRG